MVTKPARSFGATLLFMILPLILGIPMVGYLWETVNQLLAGEFGATRVAISIPLLAVFIVFLRILARRVEAFDVAAD